MSAIHPFAPFLSYFPKYEIQDNLEIFARSDEMWSIHKISDQIVPALVNHLVRMKISFPVSSADGSDRTGNRNHLSLYENLEKIQSDFLDVKDAIGRLKELEALVNEQIRALLLPNLYHIQIENEKERKAEEEARKSTESEDEESEPRDEDVQSIPVNYIEMVVPGMTEVVTTLKAKLDLPPLTAKPQSVGTQQSPSIPQESNKDPADRSDVQVISFISEGISQDLILQTVEQRYRNLEIKSKLCLLCLSVFPDNSVIRKTTLRNWWMGEEFLDIREGKTAEKETDEVFEQLISMGFIEAVKKKRSPVANRCRMHPLVRSIVISLAKRTNFLDIDSYGNIKTDSFSVSSRACLLRSEQRSSQYALRSRDPKELRALINVNESSLDLQRYWLSRAKNLSVLQLGRWQDSTRHHIEVISTDFLKSFDNLRKLRYLSLQGISGIDQLPSSISNLVSLRILDLRACHNLEKIPKEIGSLQMLTHLDISECYLMETMPMELAYLSQLQVLKGFVIGDPETKGLCNLSDLAANMKELRKLSIYSSFGPYKTEPELNCLLEFKALRSLTIAWVGASNSRKGNVLKRSVARTRDAKEKSSRATKAIEPLTALPSRLEKLDLRCYPLYTMPAWVKPSKLGSLKKLYIRGGQLRHLLCEEDSCNGDINEQEVENDWSSLSSSKKWKVEILRLKFLSEMDMNWKEFQALFPNLNYFEKVSCPKLNLLPCDGRGVWRKKL